MITKNTEQDPIIMRKVKRYGDYFIFYGIYNYSWMNLLANPSSELLNVLKRYSKFSVAMMAHSVNVFYRYRFGYATSGIVMTIMVISMLLAFNANGWLIAKPFLIFINPTLPFFISSEDLFRLAFVEIHSRSLLVFTFTSAILMLIHTVAIYLKKGNRSPTKRGTSWIYTIGSRYFLLNETFTTMIIEPAITILLGSAFIAWGDDLWIGSYLILAGSSTVYQQIIDTAHNTFNKAIVDG